VFGLSSGHGSLRHLQLRAGLKNDKTPKQRILFRCAELKIFEIHKVFLQMFALPNEKISRRCAFRHLSNKA
jgi:hypothetical protein